ncbi:MAG TPA: DUF309 domain-containing protein [Blastocatellia bacterium]|nr:DUF309 domain-containing protein [Blastocatellia bacterium]
MAQLIFDSGPRTGEAVALDNDKTVFGRHISCDCVLLHPTVSREHFCIERNGAKYLLVDRESGNGTFVNGERVSWIELKVGDRVQAGPFSFVFKSSDDAGQPSIDEQLSRDDDKPQWFDEHHKRIYPREYLEGIEHFNARRYYDAHEVWEEIWLRSSDETKLFYQMLIQAAVGLHHYERGNARGGRGMYNNVMEKLQRLPSFFMSLDLADFARQFKRFFTELIENENESAPPEDKPRPIIRLLSNDANG